VALSRDPLGEQVTQTGRPHLPKILHLPVLDTWVWAREVLHKVLGSRDHGMAWGAGRGGQMRVRMHWEDHLVWTLGAHQDTCPLQIQGEALGR